MKNLKKANPSYTDEYKLIELLEPESGDDKIIAKVKRLSDQNIFKIGLSWLECIDSKKKNYRLIDDYSVWHVPLRCFFSPFRTNDIKKNNNEGYRHDTQKQWI